MINTFSSTLLAILIASTFFAGCAKQSTRQQEPEDDIYAALRNDTVDYNDPNSLGDEDSRQASLAPIGQDGEINSAHVDDRIAEVRNLYFEQAYIDAAALSERLMRIAPYAAENFYWLARIKLAQNEVKEAHEFATRGISLTDNSALKRELKRIQRRAEIGSN